MPPVDPLRRSLANLPEELIEHILQSITCQSSLTAAALTSRQLHRITQPILNESVSIFVSRNGKPLKQYDNRRRFQQALMEQSDLASSVKTLKLFRKDAEVDQLLMDLGDNYCCILGDVASSIPGLLSSLEHLEVLDASEYFEHEFNHSPIMQSIDLWANTACGNYTPMFDWHRLPIDPPLCFFRLKVLHVSPILNCEGDLDLLFRLPNLEYLGLHRLSLLEYDSTDDSWLTIKDRTIKTLSLTNLDVEMWPDDATNLLLTMSTILKHLQTLNITAVNHGHATLALSAFKQRIPQLQTLEAYQNIEDPPERRRETFEYKDDDEDEDEDEQDEYAQDLANRLADEWRNDWMFTALDSAPALRVLRLDVTDLHTPASLKDVPGPLDWSASIPNLTNYYRDEVFAYASDGASDDCWNRVQIPLSPAVEEVYLHLRATDMRRFGIGLLHALTQLGLDLPASAPRLRRVGMVVKENIGEKDTGVVWREVAGFFRAKGVVLWRVGA